MTCIFCRIVNGEIPAEVVARAHDFVAFLDVNPLADGHVLVVPRAHAAQVEDLEPEQADALFRAVVRLAGPVREAVDAAGTTIGINNGNATGQTIPHVHVHIVPPEKLKLKADSLLKDFIEQDFGFTPDGFVRISLAKKGGGGLFGGGADKKKAETRTAVRVHLQENKPLASAPAGESQSYTAEQLQELRVVQPAASRAQSMILIWPCASSASAVQLSTQSPSL